jgi:hypothetical protein
MEEGNEEDETLLLFLFLLPGTSYNVNKGQTFFPIKPFLMDCAKTLSLFGFSKQRNLKSRL